MSLRNILFRGSYKMLKPRLQPDTTPCLDSCNRSEECRSGPLGNGGRSILCICCLLKVSRRDVTHIQSWNAFFVCCVPRLCLCLCPSVCFQRGDPVCSRHLGLRYPEAPGARVAAGGGACPLRVRGLLPAKYVQLRGSACERGGQVDVCLVDV